MTNQLLNRNNLATWESIGQSRRNR